MDVKKALEVISINEWDINVVSLKKAYRKGALKCHPDRGGSSEAFIKLQEAFNVLQKYLKTCKIVKKRVHKNLFTYVESY